MFDKRKKKKISHLRVKSRNLTLDFWGTNLQFKNTDATASLFLNYKHIFAHIHLYDYNKLISVQSDYASTSIRYCPC